MEVERIYWEGQEKSRPFKNTRYDSWVRYIPINKTLEAPTMSIQDSELWKKLAGPFKDSENFRQANHIELEGALQRLSGLGIKRGWLLDLDKENKDLLLGQARGGGGYEHAYRSIYTTNQEGTLVIRDSLIVAQSYADYQALFIAREVPLGETFFKN